MKAFNQIISRQKSSGSFQAERSGGVRRACGRAVWVDSGRGRPSESPPSSPRLEGRTPVQESGSQTRRQVVTAGQRQRALMPRPTCRGPGLGFGLGCGSTARSPGDSGIIRYLRGFGGEASCFCSLTKLGSVGS